MAETVLISTLPKDVQLELAKRFHGERNLPPGIRSDQIEWHPEASITVIVPSSAAGQS